MKKKKDIDFKSELKTSSLVKLFKMGRISSGVAAKVLGISRVDFLDLLAKYNVSMLGNLSPNDLTEEIENA